MPSRPRPPLLLYCRTYSHLPERPTMRSYRFAFTMCLAAGALAACRQKPATDDHTAHMAAGDLTNAPIASSTSQGDLSLPPSAMHTAARLAASPRHGEWVALPYPDGKGDSLMAWIVYPSTTNAKSPVVVVVHEIFGLSSWVRGDDDRRLGIRRR